MRDELKEKIAQIDTTYNLGDKMTTEFLIPNYYMDRLVDFITTYTEKECKAARIDELQLQAHYMQAYKDDELTLCGIDRTEEEVSNRINELKKGIKVV